MVSSVYIFLNLGGGEVFLILLVIIMLFGSDKLPELVKGLGRGIREINDAKTQIQNELQKSTGNVKDDFIKQTAEVKTEIEQLGQSVKRNVGGLLDEDVTKPEA